MNAILENAWFINSISLIAGIVGGVVIVIALIAIARLIVLALMALALAITQATAALHRYATRGETLTYWIDQSQREYVIEISNLKPHRIALARKGKGLEDIWPAIKRAKPAA